MSQTICSRNPVVKREILHFTRQVDVDGLGTLDPAVFPREVFWLRESEARSLLMLRLRDGSWVEMKCWSKHGDHTYGMFTSLPGPIDDARRAAATYELGDTIEVRAECRIIDTPVVKPRGSDSGRPQQFLLLPRDWRVDSLETEPAPLGPINSGWISVWSSRLTPAANDARLEAFKAEWRPSLNFANDVDGKPYPTPTPELVHG